jgi:hypothetical protein
MEPQCLRQIIVLKVLVLGVDMKIKIVTVWGEEDCAELIAMKVCNSIHVCGITKCGSDSRTQLVPEWILARPKTFQIAYY